MDPSKKGLGIAKIAKFVLGMANRLPEAASRYFKGYGVMIIGAEKGRSPGIPKGVEPHELSDLLRPYLGQNGPHWDLARLPVSEDREVLFILVDPPSGGQPPYPCCKDYQPADKGDSKAGLVDGDIYVRDKSQTRKAKSHEVTALVKRATAAGVTDVDVELTIDGAALFVRDTISAMQRMFATKAEEIRDKERREVQASDAASPEGFGRSNPAGAFKSLPIVAHLWDIPNETPTQPRDLEEVIRRQEAVWRSRWPDCLEKIYAFGATPVVVRVVTPTYLKSPEIVLTIHNARALVPEDIEEVKYHEIFPVIDEPAQSGPWGQVIPAIDYRAYRLANPEMDWTNEEAARTVRLTLTPDALRPATPWCTDDDEVALVSLDPAAETLEISWSLTAEGLAVRHDGTATLAVQHVDDVSSLLRDYVQVQQKR